MTSLPIRHIILYKHGVGFFERRGEFQGETLRLTFPRPAMDDMLKSLVAIDMGDGHVLGLDFETPEDRAQLLAKGSIHLSDDAALLDLLRDLRGREVCLSLTDTNDSVKGLVVGVDYGGDEPQRHALVSLYQSDTRTVRTLAVAALHHLEILDTTANADLTYFLRASQSEEDRRSATLHLSSGKHDLLVSYIAPAPSWRVSYRMLYQPPKDDAPLDDAGRPQGSILLQGWGLFDNQLEEDLEDVRLTLVAGMPISFRYRLYEPKTPVRPLVEDEERTVGAPVFFEGAPPPAPASAKTARRSRSALAEDAAPAAPMAFGMMSLAPEMEETDEALLLEKSESSIQVTAVGDERGALFAYRVPHTVSVARGQSAMVPILIERIPCHRDLLYNRRKLPDHPVASLRFTNSTGLTLERGPVTVLEMSDYAGEAVVPFTRDGGEVIVPYAVELGIKVEERHTSERRLIGINLRNEYLVMQEYDIRHTTYHITSTLTNAVDVMIEHVPRDGYELTETMEPQERSAGFVRWNVNCTGGARTVFEVHERKEQHRQEKVRNYTARQFQDYFRNRFLDEATLRALEEVLALYMQVEESRKRLAELSHERDGIYKQQRQIQGNLSPLTRDGEEGALRKRYVAELNRMEDRLKAIENEENRLKQRQEALEQQALAALKSATAAGNGS